MEKDKRIIYKDCGCLDTLAWSYEPDWHRFSHSFLSKIDYVLYVVSKDIYN
jgi:hypothetical protein